MGQMGRMSLQQSWLCVGEVRTSFDYAQLLCNRKLAGNS
jgi:hypothetical protein